MFIQMYRKKLDTPEAIAEWVVERKRRWPSLKRIQEKVRLLHIPAYAHSDFCLFMHTSRSKREKMRRLVENCSCREDVARIVDHSRIREPFAPPTILGEG